MIHLRRRGTLDVAAASGIAGAHGRLFVVGDDLLTLSVLDSEGGSLGKITLFEGELPEAHAERKRRKPDLEALTLLGPGLLLALGSGSRETRARGAAVRLEPGADGWRRASIRAIDLGPLYRALAADLPHLNIEGAAAVGPVLRLLQRGNGASRRSAVVDLDLAGVRAAIEEGRPLDERLVRAILPAHLGDLGGVPLGFTDASPTGDGRLVFTAAAEDTEDAYEDGACAGSAIGLLGPAAEVEWLDRVDLPLKLEGVHATRGADGSSLELLLVSDADDPSVRSPLLGATIALPPRPSP